MASTVGQWCRVLYEYNATHSDELSINSGDAVFVQKAVDTNWLSGCKFEPPSGVSQEGVFPAAYVTASSHSSRSGCHYFLAHDKFEGQQSGDLSFDVGAVLCGVRQTDDNWWEGEVEGRAGSFPITFVDPLPDLTLQNSTRAVPDGAVLGSALAKADLNTPQPGEIALKQGETVDIFEFVDNHFARGRNMLGHVGLVPIGFIELPKTMHAPGSRDRSWADTDTDLTTSSPSPTPFPALYANIDTDQDNRMYSSGPPPANVPPPLPLYTNVSDEAAGTISAADVQPYGRAKHNFVAEYEGELNLRANEMVRLIQHIDSEWTNGEVNGQVGIFPTNFVEIIVDCTSSDVSPPMTAAIALPQVPHEDQFVQFDFAGSADGDLRASAGDSIRVLRYIDPEWVECTHKVTGQRGIIPVAYIAATPVPISQPATTTAAAPATLTGAGPRGMVWTPSALPQATAFQPNGTISGSPAYKPLSINNGTPGTPKSKAPPNRPQKPPTKKPSTSTDFKAERMKYAETTRENNRTQRVKVIEEIVKTEEDFLRDVEIYRRVLKENKPPGVLSCDCLLLESLPVIISLSKQLIKNLKDLSRQQFEQQQVGVCFTKLADQFKKTYSLYCDELESAQKLVISKAGAVPVVDVYLQQLMQQIRFQSSAALDIHAVLTRPVQRVLKYPLFISELLKSTDERHVDRGGLSEAMRLMSNVAQTVDERKRRKEIVHRYRNDQSQKKLGKKFSKLNMHSVNKKSRRLGTRLTTSMGITQHTTQDTDFDANERDFRCLQKALGGFIKALQSHCAHVQKYVADQEAVAKTFSECTQNASFSGIRSNNDAWTAAKTQIFERFQGEIDHKVREPLQTLHNSFAGPDRLIAKRRDKLLDFDNASERLQKARHAGDSLKIRAAEEDYNRAQANYEALHSQLQAELPRVLSLSNAIARDCIRRVVRAQTQLYASLDRNLGTANSGAVSTAAYADNHEAIASVLAKLRSEVNFLRYGKTPISCDPITAGALDTSFSSTGSVVRRSLRDSSSSVEQARSSWRNVGPAREAPTVPKVSKKKAQPRNQAVDSNGRQTDADRDRLRERFGDRVFAVVEDHRPDNPLDISASTGDIVGVILQEPANAPGRFFVDNGRAKGFLPKTILRHQGQLQQVQPAPTTRAAVRPATQSRPAPNLGSIPVLPPPSQTQRPRPGSQSQAKMSGSVSAELADIFSAPSAPTPTETAGAWPAGIAQQQQQRIAPSPTLPTPWMQPSLQPLQPKRVQQPVQQSQQYGMQRQNSGPNYNISIDETSPTAAVDWSKTTRTQIDWASAQSSITPQVPAVSPTNPFTSNLGVVQGAASPDPFATSTPAVPSANELQQSIARSLARRSESQSKPNVGHTQEKSVQLRQSNLPLSSSPVTTQNQSNLAQPPPPGSRPLPAPPVLATQPSAPTAPIPSLPNLAPHSPKKRVSDTPIMDALLTARALLDDEADDDDDDDDDFEDEEGEEVDELMPLGMTPTRRAPVPPQNPTDDQSSADVNMARCAFDFTATSDNEISLGQNEVVAVLLRQDLEGNPEWWYVENNRNQQGYVPAAYLIPS